MASSQDRSNRRRILIVDDEPNILRFVTEVLIGAGYDVRCTDHPLEAVGLAEDFKPHLMILDMAMPGMDGLDLAEELRAGSKTSGIPVMFLTARKAADGMVDAKESGAMAYLEKPIHSSKLLWMIKALLNDGKET